MAKIGFVFPGQGSQKQGMLADLAKKILSCWILLLALQRCWVRICGVFASRIQKAL